jgi:YVTN family beta-propeller protein
LTAALGGAAQVWPVPAWAVCGDGQMVQNSADQLVSQPLLKVVASTAQLPITQRIPIPPGADWIGVGFGSVWVKGGSEVTRVDPQGNKVSAHIPISTCRGFIAGAKAMWTLDCGSGELLAIDPASNAVLRSPPLKINGSSEGSIGFGLGGVWVITGENGTQSGTLTRVDPATRKVVANIPIRSDSNGVVVGGGAVWVTNTADGTVSRVDPATNRVTAVVPVHKSPRFITSDGKYVWTLNQGDGTVSKIDPATNKVVATIDVGVPGFGGDIKFGEGAVWVTAPGTPVSRVDASTNQVTHQYTGSGGDALNAGMGSVWLPSYGDNGGELWRIDARAIEQQHTAALLTPPASGSASSVVAPPPPPSDVGPGPASLPDLAPPVKPKKKHEHPSQL